MGTFYVSVSHDLLLTWSIKCFAQLSTSYAFFRLWLTTPTRGTPNIQGSGQIANENIMPSEHVLFVYHNPYHPCLGNRDLTCVFNISSCMFFLNTILSFHSQLPCQQPLRLEVNYSCEEYALALCRMDSRASKEFVAYLVFVFSCSGLFSSISSFLSILGI